MAVPSILARSKVSSALVQLLVLGLLAAPRAPATPLSVIHTVNDLWTSLATGAARETIKAVKKSANVELELKMVPMETFQVLVGRQHHLGLEVEGVSYELLLGNEAEAMEQARKQRAATAAAASATAAAAAASAATAAVALPAGTSPPSDALTPAHSHAHGDTVTPAPSVSSITPAASFARGHDGAEVAPLQLFTGTSSSRTLELPEAVLAGPLELVLREPEPVGIYVPLAADVGGPVRRLVVEAGATVRVAGLRRVALRRPLDLPRLPGQYLAEVYAQTMTGQAEEGFESSPGIMYIASELRKAALVAANASSSSGTKSSTKSSKKSSAALTPSYLLSFDVETVTPGSLTISSASDLPPEVAGGGAAAAAPRLKVRRAPGGTVELSLRQGQVSPASASGFNPAALSRSWAWPLPHSDSSSWLPYESLLRSVLSSHPFNLDSVIRKGIGMRLTKSSIQGVHMIAFDMEVRSRQPRPPELQESPFEWNETPLEVWEAVVQVQPLPPSSSEGAGDSSAGGTGSSAGSAGGASAGGGGGYGRYRFVPLHVKRKASYKNTVTLSRSAMIAAMTGGQNSTAEPYGYEELDLGIAANAP